MSLILDGSTGIISPAPTTIASGGTNSTTTPPAGAVAVGNGTAYAFTAAGTSGQVLTSAGTGTPTWSAQSALSVGSATTATTATNVAGGVAGAVPYQTAPGVTNFTAVGTAGQILASNGAAAPTWTTPAAGGDVTSNIGYLNIPQNSQSAAYTLVLADSGKHIYHPTTDANARTFTIPANSSVAYPIGTALTFINMTSQVVTIAITTDTMYLSSAGTTGSRSLAQYGSATAIKMTSTTWLISGSGLT